MPGPHAFLGSLVLIAATASAAPPPAASPAKLSIDLDGDGSAETVTAERARGGGRGRGVRVEVQSAAGKKIASAVAPAPPSGDSVAISLSAGSLGSAGALLEVVAASPEDECRSVWRLTSGGLSRVPVAARGGSLPDCAHAGEWKWSWARPSELEPARYRGERTRETPEGVHHEVESYLYNGSRLELDAARSSAEIRGVSIPSWFPIRLYRKTSLQLLYSRFDLGELKKSPRLVWRADPSAGVFSLEIEQASGRETLPILRIEKGAERSESLVTVGGARGERQVVLTLAGGSSAPGETVLSGFDEALDGVYTPAMRLMDGRLRIFGSAEEELGSNGLTGSWTGAKGEVMAMNVASADPFLMQVGKTRCRIELGSSPAGVDVLLVPVDGTPPFGILLRGPNALERVPVRCSGGSAARDCRASGPAETFHRVGARLNAR